MFKFIELISKINVSEISKIGTDFALTYAKVKTDLRTKEGD